MSDRDGAEGTGYGHGRLAPHGILESALYVDDLARSRAFYEGVIGLTPLYADARMTALDVAGRSVLLLFLRGASTGPVAMPAGTIPPHDGHGPLHMAFAASLAELPEWERRMEANGIPIESRVRWPKGGASFYVRDPDGNLVEFATAELWFRPR